MSDMRNHLCERNEREAEYDGHGIFLCYVCHLCRKEKLAKFRRDIFTQYDCDEPIEPEEY